MLSVLVLLPVILELAFMLREYVCNRLQFTLAIEQVIRLRVPQDRLGDHIVLDPLAEREVCPPQSYRRLGDRECLHRYRMVHAFDKDFASLPLRKQTPRDTARRQRIALAIVLAGRLSQLLRELGVTSVT